MSTQAIQNPFFKLPSVAWFSSLALHILIPFLFVSLDILERNGILSHRKQKLGSEAVQSFIQVDVVALPDQLVGEKKSVDMSLPIVDNPKTTIVDAKPAEDEAAMIMAEEAAMAEKKKAAEEAMSLQREKARQTEQDKALKKLQAELEREAALKSIAKKEGKVGRERMAGNILAKGNAASGVIGNSKDLYAGRVGQAIKEFFTIYAWQKKKDLVAVLHLEIYPNGRLRAKRVIKRSSDPRFDSMVLRAVDMAQPLPLPDDLSLIDGGITVELTP